jgi:hypothetical protein
MRNLLVLVTLAVLSGCVTKGEVKERGERPIGSDRKGAN